MAVRVWDLRTGAARWEALSDDSGGVKAVAVGEVHGTPVAVTGGRDGVRVRDLRTGAPRGERLGRLGRSGGGRGARRHPDSGHRRP